MTVKDERQTGAAAEFRIIPAWAWALAGIALVSMLYVFNTFLGRQPNAPPAWARPLLGLLVGSVLGCYLLFIGYINGDAKRRGMSRVLWTIVAVVIPNALGIVLYFVLRQPLRGACLQCGGAVQPGFSFCPRCGYKLGMSCPQCQHAVATSDVYCSYCGTSLHHPAAPVPRPPVELRG
jgi:hypothetical protein